MALCQQRIKEQHQKDKLIYANMFQKFAERDSKVGHGHYSPKVEATGAIPDIYIYILILRLRPCKQKEAEKVKCDTKQNGEDAMELDNREREVASEAKA